jgi:CDP-glucose 4,6-dehydratase
VAAYLHLAECLANDESLGGEAFNFSTETPKSVLEMVQAILSAMGSTLKPDIRSTARHEIRHQLLCSRKARERLGWRPSYDFNTALMETVAWYRCYFNQSEHAPTVAEVA